jgi:hypothetical protein
MEGLDHINTRTGRLDLGDGLRRTRENDVLEQVGAQISRLGHVTRLR